MHAGIVRVPDVALTASVAVLGIALSLTGYYWDGWAEMPVAIRFAAGLIAFGLSPGLLIAGPFVAGRSRTVGPADFIISVFTCSFSCNLVFNIVLFVFAASFVDLAHAYLGIQVIGYLLWGGWAWRGRRHQATEHQRSAKIEVSGTIVVAALVLTVAATALTYNAYVNGSPPVNPEELVSLRKLADNPAVRYDNISFRDGEPTTYLFVPFQILIVGTSVLAHLDVVLTYSLFWAVTTLLSIVVITRLAYVLFGRAEVAAVVCLLIVAIGFFDPRSVIYHAGIVTPYPNRYGFGSGVLLPLGLLLFWSILRDPRIQVWRWALLIYLVVETTFVHARETILGMGTMTVVFMLLAARPRRHRTDLARIAIVLAVTASVLLAYKYINLSLAPQLDTYVAGLSEASRDAAARMIDQHGLWSALVTEAPETVTSGIDEARVRSNIAGYRSLFVDTWENSEFRARLFLPLALLALPLYALRSRSLAELSLPVLLAGLGLVTASGPLELSLAAIVGNPEIFAAHNIIFLAALFVCADTACAAGRCLVKRVGPSRVSTALLASGAAAVLVGSFVFARAIDEWRPTLAESWTSGVAWFLIVSTIVAAAYRLFRRDLPLFAEAARHQASPLALLAASCVVLVVLMPAIPESSVWRNNPFQPAYPPEGFTGDLLSDYALLDASEKLEPVAYPVEIVRFLREGVQPGQTILSRDTLALLLTAPHFAAIVSMDGAVPPRYIANSRYLGTFADNEETFAIRPYFADAHGRQLFIAMIEEFQVDLVIVDPAESESVRQPIERDGDLRRMLQPVFEAKGFLVYQVARPTLTAERSPDRGCCGD